MYNEIPASDDCTKIQTLNRNNRFSRYLIDDDITCIYEFRQIEQTIIIH